MQKKDVNSILLDHIFIQMKKLSDGDITPQVAVAQAKLIAQANILLNRAFVVERANMGAGQVLNLDHAEYLLGSKM